MVVPLSRGFSINKRGCKGLVYLLNLLHSFLSMGLKKLSLSLPHLLLFLTLFMAIDPVSTESSPTFSNETDRLALLSFKDRIVSDPFRVLASWNESLHFCKWQGIMCGSLHQRVISIKLPGQRLVGSISPSIGNLTFLLNIDLANNSLFGEIPHEAVKLFRLKFLRLADNSLRGRIPANLSHCSQLEVIGLNFNELEGNIPMELSYLSKLRILLLHANNLTGRIPPAFGNFSSLEGLILSENNLEGSIPSDLARLPALDFFQISQNKLTGTIPASLFNLSKMYLFSVSGNQLHGTLPPSLGFAHPYLELLYLSKNQFTGLIPISIANASNLKEIWFTHNQFTGSVPDNLGSLKGLKILSLGGNQLGTWGKDDLRFITSLLNCSNLSTLNINSNGFGGMLPNSIANLSTQLDRLALGNNQIFGMIPSSIQNLVNLTLLDLQENLLTGLIPTSIGKLHKLVQMFLSGNKFSGKIPPSLGNLTQLNELYLEENDLSGSIPSSLGRCKNLLVLNLSRNHLEGRIPKQVLSLSSLSSSLNFAQNALTGPLPLEVGNLRNLQEFDLSFNNLSGEIPRSLGECSSLVRVRLEGNSFQGTIPLSLSALKSIEELDLSLNNLSGPIPEFLEKLPFLKILNLSSNNFEGEVPMQGVFENASALLVHGNKNLCGGIAKLQLPACHSWGKRNSPLVKIILLSGGVLCLLFLLCFLVTFKWIKKSNKRPSKSAQEEKYLRVSYMDLSKATDGFSPSNLIGEGSYGSVYRGTLEENQTSVAVKVLNLDQRGASKSFVAECEALRNIRHRNLLKIITICSSIDLKGGDFKALVFEYMGNGNLDEWLHQKREEERQRDLTLIQRLNIAIDVASALDYLHRGCEKPIVHCDLKPSNILLDDDMVAHVGDFGLARFLHQTVGRNQTTSIQGSIGYIAPEYGTSCMVSTNGDVYSYGILLLEMFTCKRPTDDMFKDGLNLHEFAKRGLDDQVLDIVDPRLLQVEQQAVNSLACTSSSPSWIEYVVSVVTVGLACSASSSQERMDMAEVFSKLRVIRDAFVSSRTVENTRL